MLYQSPALFRIAGNLELTDIVRSQFGLAEPIHDIQPQFRVDIPIKDQSMFKAHQDYAYNNGSDNSVTIWIPLQDTGVEEGALEVVPGSHLLGVLENNQGELILDEFEYESCAVKFGEALVFDQKLVHKSGYNTSKSIRFSIQLRLSDITEPNYARRGWPQNHKTLVVSYAEPQ